MNKNKSFFLHKNNNNCNYDTISQQIYLKKTPQQNNQIISKSELTHYRHLYDNCLIENNMSKKKQFLRVNFDQFTILNDEKKSDAISSLSKNDSLKKSLTPKETQMSYTWEKAKLPKIKLIPTILNKPVLDVSERSAEKRMKIVFNQKQEAEKRQLELRNRILQSNRQYYENNSVNSSVGSKTKKTSRSSLKNENVEVNETPNGSDDSEPLNNGNYLPNIEKDNHANGAAAALFKNIFNKFSPLVNHSSTKGFKYLISFENFVFINQTNTCN